MMTAEFTNLLPIKVSFLANQVFEEYFEAVLAQCHHHMENLLSDIIIFQWARRLPTIGPQKLYFMHEFFSGGWAPRKVIFQV